MANINSDGLTKEVRFEQRLGIYCKTWEHRRQIKYEKSKGITDKGIAILMAAD